MSHARPVLLFALLALGLAACSDLPVPLLPTPTPGPAALVSPLPPFDLGAQLRPAQAAWATTGSTRYTWEISFACECRGMELRVTVVDGAVTRVRAPDRELARSDVEGFPLTVDALLQRAIDATSAGGSVQGEWSDTTGVPTWMSIDPDPHAVDDELSVTVSRFDPAP